MTSDLDDTVGAMGVAAAAVQKAQESLMSRLVTAQSGDPFPSKPASVMLDGKMPTP